MIFLLALAGAAAKAGVSMKTIGLASKLMTATSKGIGLASYKMGHTAGHMFASAQKGFIPLAKFYSREGFTRVFEPVMAALAVTGELAIAKGGK